MWSAIARVNAYWASVSRLIFTTPLAIASRTCVGLGATAAVKDVLEAGAGTALGERELTVTQHLRSQLHAAGGVDTVDVPERRSQQIPPSLAGTEHVDDAHQVIGGGVQLAVPGPRSGDPILLAPDHAALDLEHDAERRELAGVAAPRSAGCPRAATLIRRTCASETAAPRLAAGAGATRRSTGARTRRTCPAARDRCAAAISTG